MSVEQGSRPRNGKIIDPTSQTPTTAFLIVAEANSVDTGPSKNNDVSSQRTENRENYERRTSDSQSDFSQLKDSMMALLKKSDDNSHRTNVQGPSKQPKVGLDMVTGVTGNDAERCSRPIQKKNFDKEDLERGGPLQVGPS